MYMYTKVSYIRIPSFGICIIFTEPSFRYCTYARVYNGANSRCSSYQTARRTYVRKLKILIEAIAHAHMTRHMHVRT
jgi:hypothetical protein